MIPTTEKPNYYNQRGKQWSDFLQAIGTKKPAAVHAVRFSSADWDRPLYQHEWYDFSFADAERWIHGYLARADSFIGRDTLRHIGEQGIPIVGGKVHRRGDCLARVFTTMTYGLPTSLPQVYESWRDAVAALPSPVDIAYHKNGNRVGGTCLINGSIPSEHVIFHFGSDQLSLEQVLQPYAAQSSITEIGPYPSPTRKQFHQLLDLIGGIL